MQVGQLFSNLVKPIIGIFALLVLSEGVVMSASCKLQQDEELARGAFLITRRQTQTNSGDNTTQKSPDKSAKVPPPSTSPKVAQKSPSKSSDRQKPMEATKQNVPNTSLESSTPVKFMNAIGAGFTLYQRTTGDESVRVSPAKIFYDGEDVRFVIESNTDGFLYIFHAEDNGEPEMIFPNHRLNNGRNEVEAHVPYEVPSRKDRAKWISFDTKPAVEKFYIVVARRQLSNVPVGKDLVVYCAPRGEDCYWQPQPVQIASLLDRVKDPKTVSLSRETNQRQEIAEAEAIVRGVRLKSDQPEPALVYLNSAPESDMLIFTTTLTHRNRELK